MQIKLDEQGSTGSEETLQLATCWLQNCVTNHPKCRPQFDNEDWLPTRLLYLGNRDAPLARLVSTSSLSERVSYAALSHRWGSSERSVLASNLLASYERDIPISDLSPTIRDAFHATRCIGLQYLWIDSLCIVQDDPDDWSKESVSMTKVYGLATCTIAAALGGSGDDGCFAPRNQYRARPFRVSNPFNKMSNLQFCIRSQYLSEIYKSEVKDSPWYSRGWVFQERTLSPRMLIFGKSQVVWACQTLQAAEMWPCGKTSDDFIDQFESFEVEKGRLETLVDKDRIITKWDTTWWTFILDYTNSQLTRSSDRLVALQGLASKVEIATGRQYCAGLWIDPSLPRSLIWRTTSTNYPRPKENRAPTWSWASIDGPVHFDTSHSDTYAAEIRVRVLGTTSLPEPRNIASNIPVAALEVAGIIFSVTLGRLRDAIEVPSAPESVSISWVRSGQFL